MAFEWKELTDEEAANVEVTGRVRASSSEYDGMLAAVKAGKKVTVPFNGIAPKNLRWKLQGAAKKAGFKIDLATLKDGSGVLVTLQKEKAVAPAADTPPVPPPTGDQPPVERDSEKSPPTGEPPPAEPAQSKKK